jgi:opacity protein-like surface antigen
MRSTGVWITGALALLATVANAAEPPVYQPPPPPPPVLQPVCVPRAQSYMWPGIPICAEEEFATWYLRGDIGMTNQKVKKLDNFLYAGNSINSIGLEFDSSMLFGLGVGMQYNNWLRFDLTGEFRGNSDFAGLDIVNETFTDEYRAKKRVWLFLLNAYIDLGTWWCVTPFVGAGIGFSHITISSFLDTCTTCAGGGVAFAEEASQWNFAWALHAGLAFQASNNLTIELAYRYLSLGDGTSGDIVTYLGENNVNNPMIFQDISSHDFKVGFRWVCCDTPAPPPPPPPPVMYQPMPQPQLYAPPPIYAPPPPPQPLMRRG